MNIIDKIEKEQMKTEVSDFRVGDQVKVHTRVVEGGKERIQIFSGIVLERNGTGVAQSFTVRKISYNQGVERVFLLHSPKVASVEVTKPGKVRRAKLHYLRDRVGKRATTVKKGAPRVVVENTVEPEVEEAIAPVAEETQVEAPDPAAEEVQTEAPAAEEKAAPEEEAPAAEEPCC